jgi:prepilin-type N-terminal cleavage/methylation domain-containing protein
MSRRNQTGARNPGPAGFTLIELVVVMTIAGVLAASIGPKFFSQQTFSERGYADELAAALRLTQKAAVITNCPARLTLAAGTYAAAQQAASGNTCLASDTTWSTPVVGSDGTTLQGSAPANTTASPVGVFQFDTQGRLTSSPGTTVTVGARTITIDAGTGFVLVQ